MPNPKRKHTRSRRDMRRSHNWKLELSSSSNCPNCGSLRRPHCVCSVCGFYKDRVVVQIKEKAKKEAAQAEKTA